MRAKANKNLTDVSLEIDDTYGKVGTPTRNAVRREAYAYYMGQIIREARKNERVSRKELADRIGVSKSHIAKIERGLVDTDAGMFFRIIDSLGLRVEIVKPLYWM